MSVAPLVYPYRPSAWSLPGCTVTCAERRHDPAAHERYGYILALLHASVRERPVIVRTGPLTINLQDRTVTVNGETVQVVNHHGMWPDHQRRWRILETLALHMGEAVPRRELLARAFDIDDSVRVGKWELHMLTVARCRLRASLGEARRLVVTERDGGMRLLQEPPL